MKNNLEYIHTHLENIHERLREFVQYTGLSESAFCQKVGFSNGFLGKVYKNNISIGVDKLIKILSVFPELNPIWLLTGIGEMILNEEYKVSDAQEDYITSKPKMKSNLEELQKEFKELRKRLDKLEKEKG